MKREGEWVVEEKVGEEGGEEKEEVELDCEEAKEFVEETKELLLLLL